ncbi:HPr family phosphocarrier protein [Planctomicrobium sp.]|jgi:phosphotransferase system HPr (HPr) family protein|nr:HPr family phosphocarrier protein [Planctomicrobium sp.]MBT5018013.1 HPr family phosphocarrier protein [Planctomicrobium sp.]MDB4733457.1 HPr family phosphocarrier protein [Planctomicrobium sp.]MDB4802652.1 HPr family phosphocarrier protein [bacterium]
MSESGVIRRTVLLKIEQGLHLRACSNVVAIVEGFQGKVSVSSAGKTADASSMFDLLQLAAMPGTELELEASGDGSEEIVNRLEALFSIVS